MESKALSNREILDKFLVKKRLKKAFYKAVADCGLDVKMVTIDSNVISCFWWDGTPLGQKWLVVHIAWNKLWYELKLDENKGLK